MISDRSPNILADSGAEEKGDDCLTVVNKLVVSRPGIVQVAMDTAQERLSVDYDPQLISEPAVQDLSQQVASVLQNRWATCSWRLEKQGGRACESCALALENRLEQLPGIRQARASYMGGVLRVTYDGAVLSPAGVAAQIHSLGIPIASPSPTEAKKARPGFNSDRLEAIFTLITLLAMVGAWLAERTTLPPIVHHALFALAYVAGGAFGLKAGLESLRQWTIDVDLLMVLAALGAAVVDAPFEGAMLLFLFSLSNVLQNYALDRTRNAIRALMALRPAEALVKRGEQWLTVAVEQVGVGERLLLRPGERAALDGLVVEGRSSFDQSPITGESMPVAKRPGDAVLAGTVNQQGSVELVVTRPAHDSTIARLIRLVEEAHSEKAKTQRFIDQAEQYYAVGVIVLTLLAISLPLLFSPTAQFGDVFYRAMTLMVAASPCALVISTPATVLSAIGNGAKRGVLFKGGVYVEQAAEMKVIAFDKTGTLTLGKPKLTDIHLCQDNVGEDELLALVAAIESRSEHPLAQAIVAAAKGRGLQWGQATDFHSLTGKGVWGMVSGRRIAIGNARYFAPYQTIGLETARATMNRLQDEGKSAIMAAEIVGEVAHLLGVMGVADTLRPESAQIIAQLKQSGIRRVIMLTGDNERVAKAIAAQAGVDDFYADLLPEDKLRILKEEAAQFGPVAMVGDGVNDAPALAAANIGIAMGAAGSDVAMETADIVLMSNNLHNLPYLVALSRQTRKVLIQNLFFATGMILLLIAAVLGLQLPLPLSVIGHEGSTVLVSLNGLRLLAYRPK